MKYISENVPVFSMVGVELDLKRIITYGPSRYLTPCVWYVRDSHILLSFYVSIYEYTLIQLPAPIQDIGSFVVLTRYLHECKGIDYLKF